MQQEHLIGLRFPRSQARVLRAIAARIRAGEVRNEHATLFDQAAKAAADGEPLVVSCGDPMEALLMVEGFARFGVARPAIEQLSGTA